MRRIIGIVSVSLFVFVPFSFAAEKETKWTKFNVGSWVLYDLGNGMQQKQTLVSKSENGVTLKIEMVVNGKPMPATEAKISMATPSQPAVKPKVKETTGSIDVKGQAANCTIYEITTDQGVSRSWMADNIPGGVLQTAIGDKVLMKLVDFEAK
jgi:hypothetical protein